MIGVIAIDVEISSGEFDRDGVKRLEAMVKSCKTGVLARADFGVNWRPATAPSDEAWIEVWEEPAYGRAYLATLKASTDGWSVFILRKSCPEPVEGGGLLNDACVCRINPESARAWDAALLADRVELLLRWYGNPSIVPDARNGLDILERLKEKGASIHRRPAPSWRSDIAPGADAALGWETTERNLPVAIAALARAIREGSVDIWDEATVRDIRRFTRRDGLDNGDTVALGIGLHCLEAATIFTAPAITHPQAAWGITMLDTRSAPLAAAGACR